MQTSTMRLAGLLAPALLAGAAAAQSQVTFSHLKTETAASAGTEICAYDAGSKRIFVTDPEDIAILVYQTTAVPGATLLPRPSISLGGIPNSVAVKDGLVAVAVEGATKQDPGFVEFYDVDGNPVGAPVQVGSLPDMITFTPDGTKVLTANEGEADDTTGLINPEGSISIVDVASRSVQTADFNNWDLYKDGLKGIGVRLQDVNGVTVSQDLEPEYIAISPDGATAYVTLQEANTIAIVDIATATVTNLRPLGEQNMGQLPFDASNEDGIDGNFLARPILGLYMPDAICTFEVNGTVYYATANEGDDRADFPGFEDDTRGASLEADFTLDAEEIPNPPVDEGPDTNLYTLAQLADEADLGRLKFCTSGYDIARGDTDADGDIDQLYCFGARSVSIWKADTGARVFDSNTDFGVLGLAAGVFADNRSDDKGSEPEAVTSGVIDGRTFLFVGLERYSAIVVYDVSDMGNVTYAGFLDMSAQGAVSPEGLTFISAADSATGNPQLVIAAEVSATVSLYELVVSGTGTAYCFGDGSGTACPCGNAGAADAGCANSTGAGATLVASGVAKVDEDSLVLTASGLPAPSFGLFYSGVNQPQGGAGKLFGNGLRCVAQGVNRLEVVNTVAGTVSTSVGLAAADGVVAGETRNYQFWYRDAAAGTSCIDLFNATNGLSVTWELPEL